MARAMMSTRLSVTVDSISLVPRRLSFRSISKSSVDSCSEGQGSRLLGGEPLLATQAPSFVTVAAAFIARVVAQRYLGAAGAALLAFAIGYTSSWEGRRYVAYQEHWRGVDDL